DAKQCAIMALLDVRLLGIAELTLDGAPVRLKRRHSLALLSYLILTGRPHSREELATLLAGDLGEVPARKRLRNALADLVEQGLGEYLLSGRDTIGFAADAPHTC